MNTNEAMAITHITASYRWTAVESIHSGAWVYRDRARGLLKLFLKTLLFMLIPALLFAILVTAIVSPESLFDLESWKDGLVKSSGSLVQIVGLAALLFGIPWILTCLIPSWSERRRIRQNFVMDPESGMNIGVTIEAESLTWKFGDAPPIVTGWQAYRRVVKTRDGFCFVSEEPRTWIPEHAFGSKDDISALRRLAQLHADHYDEIA